MRAIAIVGLLALAGCGGTVEPEATTNTGVGGDGGSAPVLAAGGGAEPDPEPTCLVAECSNIASELSATRAASARPECWQAGSSEGTPPCILFDACKTALRDCL